MSEIPEKTKEYRRQWYLRNRKRIIKKVAAWRKAKPNIKKYRYEEGKKYRAKYREKEKLKVKKWQILNREKCNARTARYNERHKEKVVARRKKTMKRQRKIHAKKYKARSLFYAAKKGKRIVPQPCCHCGKSPAHGHHSNYNKPLEVVWYCRKHHNAWHRLFLATEIGERA